MDEDMKKILNSKMKPFHFKELRSSIVKAAKKNTIDANNEPDAYIASISASNEIAERIYYSAGNIMIIGRDTFNEVFRDRFEFEVKQSEEIFGSLYYYAKAFRFNVLLDYDADYSGIIITYSDNFLEGFVNPAKRDFYSYVSIGDKNA
jgi:hypothetical protein